MKNIKIDIPLGNLIMGLFVVFLSGFFLPFVLKQLGVNLF